MNYRRTFGDTEWYGKLSLNYPTNSPVRPLKKKKKKKPCTRVKNTELQLYLKTITLEILKKGSSKPYRIH